MFLLLLMGLGAASVKAQVRIGGNTPPSAAAVLDLNANDDATPTGNKGALALPRVSLASNTAQLNGTTPANGMLVYNTNESLGTGVYYWSVNKWLPIAYVPVDSIILNKTNVNIPIGVSWTPRVTIAPAGATDGRVTWSSSNPGIASVNSVGQIMGNANGSAVITATSLSTPSVSKTINVLVWTSTIQNQNIGAHSYQTIALPNIGTWTYGTVREGSPDTLVGNRGYYSGVNIITACPAPWSVPDSASLAAYATFMNNISSVNDMMMNAMDNIFTGSFRQRVLFKFGSYFAMGGVNSTNTTRYILDFTGFDTGNGASDLSGPWRIFGLSAWPTSAVTVRCHLP